MTINSKIKKGILVILLVFVSFVLSVIGLFSERLGGKISQAQAQCWTSPGTGGSSCGGEEGGGTGAGCTGGGCSCCACGSCSCAGCGCTGA